MQLTARAVSAALHTPQLGGARCHRGPKIPVPLPLSTPENASTPQIEIHESLEISKVRGFLKRKVHYSYFGPLWKQSCPLIHCNCCWAPLKTR